MLVYPHEILHNQTPQQRGDEGAEYVVWLSKATPPRSGFVQPCIQRDTGSGLWGQGSLAQFAKRRSLAQQRYAQFVAEGINASSPLSNLKGQVFLGDEQFVLRMQARLRSGKDDVQIPIEQRRPPAASISGNIERYAQDRNAAIVEAYATGGYSYQRLADYFGVHFTTVGKIVRGVG